eukprot:g5282.t1
MTTLGQALQRRGHRVSLLATPDYRPLCESREIDFLPIGVQEHNSGALFADREKLSRLQGFSALRLTGDMLCARSVIVQRDAPALLEAAGVDAVVWDQVTPGGESVAELLGLPHAMACNALAIHSESGIPPAVTGWRYGSGPFRRMRNRLGNSLIHFAGRPMARQVNRFRRRHGIQTLWSPTVQNGGHIQVAQQPRFFDFPDRELPQHFHYTGPWHTTGRDADTPFPWERLDGQPVVYASLGTLQNRLTPIFNAIARACGELNVQLILSLGGSDARIDESLAAGSIVVPYAPQLELLKVADAVVTHAGLNTALETLALGKPMARRSGDEQPVELRVWNREADQNVLWNAYIKRLKIIRLIDHPSIVRVLDIADGHDPPYVVVEPSGGRSLRGAFDQRVPLTPEEAVPIAARLAEALARAHRFGVAHGGLKADAVVWNDPELRIDLTAVVPTLQSDLSPSTAFAADVLDCGRLFDWLYASAARRAGSSSGGDSASESAALGALIDRMLDDDPLQRPSMAEVAARFEFEAACLFSSTVAAPPAASSAEPIAPPTTDERPSEPPPKQTIRVVREGDRLGRFRLLDELGKGGMGSVFRARDEADDTIVAVKVMRAEASQSTESLSRFRREAQVLTDVNNPHVTNLIEFNEEDGIPYLVMEFVAGRSLQKLLEHEKKLDEPTAVAMMSDVCKALSSAHRRGIIHRDIKPDNILLIEEPATTKGDRRDVRVKLSDFGIARRLTDTDATRMTRTGSALGTPLYMSPEQCEDGHTADARSDVYSVGATLFHLLAGRPPFLATSFARLVRKHVEEPPPDLKTLDDGLSQDVCGVVDRSLAKQPQQRFSGSEELLDALETLLDGEPSPAESHPVPPADDSGRVLTYSWSWDLQSPPHLLWPYVSNTDRFNRAVGLPVVQFTDSRDSAGRLQRFGRFSKLGVAVCWKENPFEWTEGRQFGVLREYTQGPFQWVTSDVLLTPHRQGTRLTHTIRIKPAGLPGRLLSAFEIGFRTRRGFDKVYRHIDDWLQKTAANDTPRGAFDPPQPLSRRQWQRLEAGLRELHARGVPESLTEKLGDYLAESSPQEVAQLRPVVLARQLQLMADDLLTACLHGARTGLLSLAWDILCPLCRVSSAMHDTLRAVADHMYCPACDLDFALDPAESIELVFRIHESIREVDTQTYCIGGPAHLPHVVAQLRIAPGERTRLKLSLAAGQYAIRVTGRETADRVSLFSGAAADRADWCYSALGKTDGFDLKPGEQQIVLQNDSEQEIVVRLERSANRGEAIVAAQALLLPLFRELFPDEVVTAERLREIPQLTLLAAKPTATTAESGNADDALRQLESSIVENQGTLIDRRGETRLALFYGAADAFRAATHHPERQKAFAIAIHCGTVKPAFVVKKASRKRQRPESADRPNGSPPRDDGRYEPGSAEFREKSRVVCPETRRDLHLPVTAFDVAKNRFGWKDRNMNDYATLVLDQKRQILGMADDSSTNRLALLLLVGGIAIWPALGLAFSAPAEGFLVSTAVVFATAISLPVTLLAMYVTAYLLPISFGTLKSATLRTLGLQAFCWSSMLLLCCVQIADPLGWVCAVWPIVLVVNLLLFARMFDFDLAETFTCLVVFALVQTAISRLINVTGFLPIDVL